MQKKVTFVIPIFDLKEYRINNLKFILPYILKTGCRTILAEQVSTEQSPIKEIVDGILAESDNKNFEHVLYMHDSPLIHKTGLINSTVATKVDTEYVWVNDVDCYLRFNDILEQGWYENFVQPYDFAKKLSKEDSAKLMNGEKIEVDFSDESAKYISLYGALSFIFDKAAFLEIGGMDESLFGWGEEDVELDARLKEKQTPVQVLSNRAIHLWHPVDDPAAKYTASYEEKKTGDMAVIATYFNWCGYNTPLKNLNRFLNQMEAENIPVYGIELSLTDKFATKSRSNWKHIRVKNENVCFQKEACINLVEKEIPKKYSKIAWIDCDLYFTNRNWYADTSKALDTYKIVQMYENGTDTDIKGEKTRTMKGLVFSGGPVDDNINVGFPGGAIAARRDFFRNGGLYPYSFMGAGDTILMCAIYNVEYKDEIETKLGKYKSWRNKIQGYLTRDDISCVNGDFIHEWHGDKQNRNYHSRRVILSKVNWDKNVVLNQDGILSINESDDIHKEILAYFRRRLEDGDANSWSGKAQKKNDMAVVSVHFNWAKFKTPVRNLNRFILDMEGEKIPLYGIELSLDGKFDTEKYPNWIKIRVKMENVCFQKEACINLLEKYIPAKYTKIAWIDHDVYFKNRNWYNEASEKLDTLKVIQLFSEKISTDRDGFEVSSIPSLMKAGDPTVETKLKKYIGTPGVALAARRELWNYGGLYPYSIMGGGDSVFLYSIYNHVQTNLIITASAGMITPFAQYTPWKNSILNYVNRSCGHISGEVVHSWHGEMSNRRYDDRYSIIADIDWNKSVQLNKYGLVEIVDVERHIYDRIYSYFRSRNEDGEQS